MPSLVGLFDPSALPQGAIHADYFPDNVLFDGAGIGGVIDFYFGCNGAWAYDLAIALSAWGFDAEGRADEGAIEAFRAGYDSIRPLSRVEVEAELQAPERLNMLVTVFKRPDERADALRFEDVWEDLKDGI